MRKSFYIQVIFFLARLCLIAVNEDMGKQSRLAWIISQH
jgi:hypothetical protein